MQVLIAGGGIGGLAAALACSIGGHQVQLFERTAEFAEVGAGVQLGPNAVKVLHDWGLSHSLKSVAAFPDNLQVRSAVSGDTLGRLSLGQSAVKRYGFPYATLHRADLHGLLLTALRQQPQVNLNLGAAVHSFSQGSDGVALRANDGKTVVQGDLLVGADGLWSRVRQQLLNDGAPQTTGHLAYRALVSQASLPVALRSNRITAWLGPRMHAVQYPVRGGEWLNVVVIIEGQTEGLLDNWDHDASTAALRHALAGVCTPLHSLVQAVDNWGLWSLCIRPPMRDARAHAQGRVALLGDAAHPMLPYLAQGAGMAMEDAVELGHCLQPCAEQGTDVPAQLQRYASRRWQRNARVQSRAIRNGRIFHARGLLALGRDLSLKCLGERVLDMPWLYQPRNNPR
jgi:salicylate hydroxylase